MTETQPEPTGAETQPTGGEAKAESTREAEPVGGARRRNFSPWAHWQLHLAAVTAKDPLPKASDGIPAWRERVRIRLADLLGPLPSRVPLGLEVLDSTDCGSYRRDRVVFDTEATMSVPAFVLVPLDRDEPGPAILAIHGHGPGKEEVCALDTPSVRAAYPEHRGDYAHRLAEHGYVVLAPDLRCFGERADWQPEDRYHCDVNLVHAVIAGVSPLTQNLWDMARAVDVLAQHPLVNAERIGVVGFSYGATVALFLAAWDERVRAAVISGYFSSFAAAHRVPWNLCGSQVLPGTLGLLEHVDLGALVAPRPLLVETGTDDPLFPLDAARRSVADLRRVYEVLGVPPGALEHVVRDGAHRWYGDATVPFLAHRL